MSEWDEECDGCEDCEAAGTFYAAYGELLGWALHDDPDIKYHVVTPDPNWWPTGIKRYEPGA